jgi:hypothetical protein
VSGEQGRILIRSPKTEHHECHESRLIPVFSELRPRVPAGFDGAEPVSEYATSRYPKGNNDLRTQPADHQMGGNSARTSTGPQSPPPE